MFPSTKHQDSREDKAVSLGILTVELRMLTCQLCCKKAYFSEGRRTFELQEHVDACAQCYSRLDKVKPR